jgi:hypothetical protein
MNYRYYENLAMADISTAGTTRIDLKGEDPISALMLQIRLKGTTGTPNMPCDGAIKRIRILDGSTEIFNCKGIGLVPLHFNTFKQEPFAVNMFINNVDTLLSVTIPFGRHIFDPDYALDPKQFKNLKIEIEHDYTLAGLGTPSAAYLEVYTLMYDQKIPTLKGFLGYKEVYAYAMVSSGVKYIPLPVDHPIKALYIQSRAVDKAINSQYNKIKLREDSDKHVIFNESTSNFAKMLQPQQLYHEMIYGTANTDTKRLHYGFSCYESYLTAVSMATGQTVYSVLSYGPSVDVRGSTTNPFTAMRQGYCPNGSFYLPLGKEDEPSDWYKPNRDTDLELIVTAGSGVGSGSTLEVLLQQEILY